MRSVALLVVRWSESDTRRSSTHTVGALDSRIEAVLENEVAGTTAEPRIWFRKTGRTGSPQRFVDRNSDT